MRQTTRYGLFETNSSSMHTLVIPYITEAEDANLNADLDELSYVISFDDYLHTLFSYMCSSSVVNVPKTVLLYLWNNAYYNYIKKNDPKQMNLLTKWVPNTVFVCPALKKYEEIENLYINHQSINSVAFKYVYANKKNFAKAVLYGEVQLLSDGGYFSIEENPDAEVALSPYGDMLSQEESF